MTLAVLEYWLGIFLEWSSISVHVTFPLMISSYSQLRDIKIWPNSLWVFRKKTTEALMTSLFMLTLIQVTMVVLATFLHCKVTLFSSVFYSLEASH